jgi:hypothetical protein
MLTSMPSQAGNLTEVEAPASLFTRSSSGVKRHACLAVVIAAASRNPVGCRLLEKMQSDSREGRGGSLAAKTLQVPMAEE